jgi:hypothetical protein
LQGLKDNIGRKIGTLKASSVMCLKVQGLLGSCRLAFQDSYMKQGKLNCRRKMDLKFMVDSCFLCSRSPVTAAVLEDTIRDAQCLMVNVNLSHWHGGESAVVLMKSLRTGDVALHKSARWRQQAPMQHGNFRVLA